MARGVSIHASAREASTHGRQPRRRAKVSIHASAREARCIGCGAPTPQPPFQSTPPRGRRGDRSKLFSSCSPFQSTPPRGRRVKIMPRPDEAARFNPRLRAGGEQSRPGAVLRSDFRFNPRLRAGGELAFRLRQGRSILFQSTPPRGRRAHPGRPGFRGLRFNPRLRAGGEWKLPELK